MRPLSVLALVFLIAPAAHAAAPPGPSPAVVQKLIDQLGDDEVREAAQKRLTAFGEPVIPALRRAGKEHADIDVRLRAMVIISAIEKGMFGEVRVYKGHTDGVIVLALSPDGKRMASGAWKGHTENAARVWDVETGKEVLKLDHGAPVGAIAWTADGKKILTGGNDRQMMLWDSASGKKLLTLTGTRAGLYGVAITPDGKRAVSCSSETVVRAWDLASGKQIATHVDSDQVRHVAAMPDSKHFVSASFAGTVCLVEVETGKVVREMQSRHSQAWFVAVSKDGKRIASTGADKLVKLHDAETGKLVKEFVGHTNGVHAIAYSPDGKRLISGDYDRNVIVWDVESGKAIQRHDDHEDIVTCAAFLPDGKFALTSSYDKTIRLWKLRK